MSVKLTLKPEQEEIINRNIASGRFNTPQEVIDAALRLLQEQELIRQHRLEQLRRDIDLGDEQIAQGRVREFDPEDIKRRVRERLAEQTHQVELAGSSGKQTR
jgi:antitoxin ParD1/3/4